MGITSEVSEIIQSSKEQFEKAMTTSLAVDVLKNIVLRSMPAEGNEMEKINDPKFRTSFNSILNPITANLVDKYQSVGQFDTGNLFTSMVTSIADSVSLESNYRTEALESKFYLNKIPLDSNREWVGEIKKAYESLKFSSEDIKNRFSNNLKYIYSFEAGREIIDDIKNEVKRSIDETESKNELVEGTLQEIADYKKEVAPPDDEYLDAENPDDQAKAGIEDEEGELDADGGNAENDAGGSEETGATEAGGEGEPPAAGSEDISSGEAPLEGEEGDDLNLDTSDDLGGEGAGEGDDLGLDEGDDLGGGDIEEGGDDLDLGDGTDQASGSTEPAGGNSGMPGEDGSTVRQVKQGNVVININASGESSDPTKSTEGFGFKKSKKVYDSKEELLKSPELKAAVNNFKHLVEKSGGKYTLPTKEEYQKIFKKYEADIGIEQTKDFSTNLLIIDGVCLTMADMAWKGAGMLFHNTRLNNQKKKNTLKGIRYIQIGAPVKLIGKGKGGKDLYRGKNITGSVAYRTIRPTGSESFTAKDLKAAKASLPLHTAESFARSYIPIHERDLNDVSFPEVKLMASEAVNAVGDVKKELGIRIAAAKYAIEKGSLSKEDKDVLFGKIDKFASISNEAVNLSNIWGNALQQLGLTQNGLINSNESTLFIARNIISRFLTKTKVPNALPLPYTSKENVLSNAFDIVQLRHIISSQEHPVKAALDDLISRENVFYRNIVDIDDSETKDKATAVIDTSDMVYNKALTANFITDYNIKSWEQNVGKDQKDTNAEVCSRVEDKFKALYQRELNSEEKEIIKATTNNHDVTEIIPTPYEKFLIKLSKEDLAAKSTESGKQIPSLSKEENENNRFKAKIFTSLYKSLEKFNLVGKDDLTEVDKFCSSVNVNLLHS
jgi:hypothetical protein